MHARPPFRIQGNEGLLAGKVHAGDAAVRGRDVGANCVASVPKPKGHQLAQPMDVDQGAKGGKK